MNYKIYISGFIEESNQLLVSFSSDDTKREAVDYQSLAFDVAPYGDISAQEVVKSIAKVAPSICSDMIIQEKYTADDEKSMELQGLVGQTFSFTEEELFPKVSPKPSSDPAKVTENLSMQSEKAEEI